MKKNILITIAVAALTTSSFAQGTFNMIWYNGADGISIGSPAATAGTTGWYLGQDYSVEAYLAAGAGQSEASLNPIAASLTSFNLTAQDTSASLTPANGDGQFYVVGAIVTSLPTGDATIQVRAWYNGGMYGTYDAAVAAKVNTGTSGLYTINLKANTDPTVQSLTDIGMAAFTVTAVPEPTTFALAGLGAAALLFFRRRK